MMIFKRKSRSLSIYELEEQSPSPDRTRKLSTESNSGVFTITESFEYDNDIGLFYSTGVYEDTDRESIPKKVTQRFDVSSGSLNDSCTSTVINWNKKIQNLKDRFFTIRNAFRLVAYAICFFYCSRYAGHIIYQYSKFETIVTLEYQPPRKTLVPAISVCSHCVLCTIPDRRLMNLSIQRILDNDHTWRWVENSKHDPSDSVDMSVDCHMTNLFHENHLNCSDIVKPLISLQEGHKCLTFFSNLDAKMRALNRSEIEPLVFDYNFVPKIILTINGTFLEGHATGTEFFSGTELNMNDPKRSTFRRTGVYIKLHERDVLPDMKDLNYHHIKAGVKTTIAFTKKTVRLLPKPYQTRCHNYSQHSNVTMPPWHFDREIVTAKRKIETSSGPNFYRTRGECILYCLWRSLAKDRCVNFFSLVSADIQRTELMFRQSQWLAENFNREIPNPDSETSSLTYGKNSINHSIFTLNYCTNSQDQYIDYVNAKNLCVGSCPEECYVEYFYEDNIQEMINDRAFGKKWDNQTQVHIEWAVGPVTNVYHDQRMDFNEFVGTLGGHVHIWIGWSIPFFIKIIINILRWFRPLFQKIFRFFLSLSCIR